MTSRAWTLPAAAWLAAAEAAGLIAVVGMTGNGGKELVIAFLAAKFPFCWMVARLRPSAYLALLLWELGGVVAAVDGNGVALALRLVEVTVAVAVTVLLIASTPQFPSVTLESQT